MTRKTTPSTSQKEFDKVALVTGASSGIGKATAQQLLDEGYKVYVAARRVEKMADLNTAGASVIGMDITKDEDVEAAVQRIADEEGRLDVLVNNAGFGMYGSVEETSIEDARYQFDVNIFGLAKLTQLVIPMMRRQGKGTIINISSIGGKIYTPLGAWYHATKHALEGWSDCLRLELADHGIDVVIVEPGAIATEFGDVMSGPMLKRSGSGPYAKLATGLSNSMEQYAKPGAASPPEVIAKQIAKAVNARRPKTRYAAGKFSGLMLFIRRYFSDRFFDRAVMSMVR